MLSNYGVYGQSSEELADTTEKNFIKKAQEHLSIGGGFSISTAYYNAFGDPPQRDPFYWQISGNVDVRIGNDISMPFSATFNQQERSFTQPFNQYGVSPKYKWATAHLGFRSVRFSEYSLSGNQFLGLGVELYPENSPVRGKALIGRFAKAVDGYFTDGRVSGSPSFERWGYGVLLEAGKPRNNASLYLFKGKDDMNSITEFANDATIKPAENLIVGISTKQEFKKHFTFDGEINFSAYTRDIRTEESVLEGYTYLNNLGTLFFANATSTFNKAIKGEFAYTNSKFKIGLGYRRIDPDYLSMGSVYLNNDFEDVQLKTMFRTLKNKMNVSVSGGVQRNNLNNDKATQMIRLIASVAGTYVINNNWNAMVNLSNFNSASESVIINTLDTMRYAQVTRSASSQIMYSKANDKIRYATGLSGNYQNARVLQNDTLNANSSSELVNANLSFQLGFLKTGINISTSLSGAMNITGARKITTLGPTIALNKRFISGKLTLSFASSVLRSYVDYLPSGFILNLKSNNNYRINRHHAVTNTLSLISKATGATKFDQFIGTIGYNYVF